MAKVPTAGMEDYVETIANLADKNKVVRVRDIAKRMNIKMPSVTEALKNLSKHGFVNHEKYEYVELTSEGNKLAYKVRSQHNILFNFLTGILNISPLIADKDACRMEHVVSPPTLNKLLSFIEFVRTCPLGEPDWLRNFEYYSQHGQRPEEGFAKTGKEENGGKIIPNKSLWELKPGRKGKIARVVGRGATHRRTLDMGVVPGVEIEVEQVSPLRDLIEVKIKGHHLSLRKEEAANIYVKIEGRGQEKP